MLYLIRSFGRKRTSLKVGFTDKPVSRFLTYRHDNPFHERISTREGSAYDEKLMHLYLESWGFRDNFLDEWFLDVPEVYTLFHAKREKMLKRVWNCRERLFKKDDFKRENLKCRIYEDLRLQHRFSSSFSKEIDKVWKIESNKKLIKSYEKLQRADQFGEAIRYF